MKEYTKDQPVDGETILSCGHEQYGPYHFWKVPHEFYFRRPDGSVGTACWIMACNDCKEKCCGNASKIEIKEDFIWKGKEPAIWRNKNE